MSSKLGIKRRAKSMVARSRAKERRVREETAKAKRNPKGTLVFVYGTLRQEGWNNHYLAGQTFVQTAITEPKYEMVVDNFPWLRPAASGGAEIVGEVWEVDAKCFQRLLQLERGYVFVDVALKGIQGVKAFMATPDSEYGKYLARLEAMGRKYHRTSDFIEFVRSRANR